MPLSKRPPRSILKRRGSISTAVQTLLDLVAVMGLALLLIHQQIGVEYSSFVDQPRVANQHTGHVQNSFCKAL